MDQITITEILKGVTAGAPQTCGYMTMIPLVSSLVRDDIASPAALQTSTSGYGTLIVNNTESAPSILPSMAAVISKMSAQDHATGKAFFVPKKGSTKIDTAACIQSSQPGMIPMGSHEISILPFAIREGAFSVKDVKSYSKLWPMISSFNADLGLQSQGHLDFYLTKFKDELNKFVAEFEPVAKQVGAIILINGNVVGIERAPNYAYWNWLFRPMIRECYGSYVLYHIKKFGDSPPPPKIRVPINAAKVSNLDELEEQFDLAQKKEIGQAKDVVRDLLEAPFDRKTEEAKSGFSVESLENKQFVGQIVREGDEIFYASLILSKGWAKSKKWAKAKPFNL